jgi:hypothetical protein
VSSSLLRANFFLAPLYEQGALLTFVVSALAAYPWSRLSVGSTVTDVGGGVGHISMDLARTFPQLNFVVQDLPATVEQGREVSDLPLATLLILFTFHARLFNFISTALEKGVSGGN